MAKQSDVRGLSAADDLRDAAAKIIWTRFEDMWTYREAVIKDFNIDAVHDMRVASRRLRTAMQTFRPCFPRKTYMQHYRSIQEVADLLGEVRDRDVLLDELDADVERLPESQRGEMAAFTRELHEERQRSRETLQNLLDRLNKRAYDRTFLSYIARSA